MKKQLEFIVRTRDDLRLLTACHRLKALPNHGKISLQIFVIKPHVKNLWEKKLNKVFFDCGCNMGAAFGIMVMATYLIYCVFYNDISNVFKLYSILISFAYFFMGGFVGKILGLLLSKYRLKKIIRELLKIVCEN